MPSPDLVPVMKSSEDYLEGKELEGQAEPSESNAENPLLWPFWLICGKGSLELSKEEIDLPLRPFSPLFY